MPTPPKLNAEAAKNLKLMQLAGKAARYLAINDTVKPLEAEKKGLSSELKEFAKSLGTKEGKGYALTVPGFKIGCVVPVSNVVDHQKALAALRKLNLVERCTTTIVDEKALEIAFQEGLIDMEVINSFTVEQEQSPRISITKA